MRLGYGRRTQKARGGQLNQTRHSFVQRLVAVTIAVVQASPGFALPQTRRDVSTSQAASVPEKVVPNRQQPTVVAAPALPRFSSPPLASEIYHARVFDEPFVPLPGPSSVDEDRALARALTGHIRTGAPTDVSRFEAFARTYPGSRWTPSILLGIGTVYRRTGYFTRALESWERSWALLKGESDPKLRALADRAVGELAELNSRLGRYERLESLFAEIGERDVRGPASEKVRGAREGYVVMQKEPERAFRCGPFGIGRILASIRPNDPYDAKIANATSTRRGTSLRQMLELANTVGLNMQMARRDPAAPVITPALVHWKAGHFAALVREERGRFLLQDPTFGDDLWVSRRALDDEGSGYYLIPAGPLPPGWTAISAAKGDEVWGKGIVGTANPKFQGGGQPSAGGNSPTTCVRMAQYTVNLMLVNLHVWDTPVGYKPPVGPAMEFQVAYNQREVFQPQLPTYSNFGAKWTFDWFAFVQDDPADLSQNVDYYRPGGGLETYTGFSTANDTSNIHYVSRATLVRVSSTRYERRLADGSVEVFAQPDGSVVYPRRLYRTEVIDPQGNHATYAYSYSAATGGFRLISATDAIGQVTTLSYEASDPLKITKVTDPFGRYATFEYDGSDRLRKITDVIGLTSEFTYGANDFISSLTTPYGTTTFETGQINATAINRWLETTDPLGGKERVEFLNTNDAFPFTENAYPTGMGVFNVYMNARNSYFWDKRAMASPMPFGYEKASVYHWLHSFPNTNEASGILESEKKPLEGRIWYNYAGQTHPAFEGTAASPTYVGRVLDDGATQMWKYEYNAKGKVTKAIDPVGRETVFVYGTNNTPDPDPATGTAIDLLQVKQKNGATYELVASFTYNTQHQPITITDAAGQTTTHTYNLNGTIATIVTPPRNGLTTAERTTTYNYFADNAPAGAGRLQTVTDPSSAQGSPSVAYTYDGYSRVRTKTDQEGYSVTYDYDALDRPTRTTYPDGTFQESQYNRLDAEGERDRLGHWTHTFHDALRRPVATRDPLGRTITQEWCTCGSLEKRIDASGNATRWERDVQGRVTREIRSNGSSKSFIYENTTSRVKQVVDAKNQTTAYGYYLDGKLSGIAYANAQSPTASVAYTFDPAYNRLTTMVDGTGTTTYSYYAVGVLGALQLASMDGPLGNDVVTYAYDELGRPKTESVNGTTVSDVAYDSLGRLVSDSNPLGSFTYSYDGATSRLSSIAYPNGQSVAYAYFGNSGDHRLQDIHNKLAGGVTLSRFQYTYDPSGNVTTWNQQRDANPPKLLTFGYDAADQLATAARNPDEPTLPDRFAYAFDSAGNRTAEQLDDNATQASYDDMNRLSATQPGGILRVRGTTNEPATVTVGGAPATVTSSNEFEGRASAPSGTSTVSVAATDYSGNTRTNTYQVTQTGVTTSFSYDVNGNMTSDGLRTYEWDAENRLLAINHPSNRRTEFTYNGHHQRVRVVEKDNNVVTSDRRLLWSDLARIREERAADGTVGKRFFDLGMMEGTTNLFYTLDHLKSVRDVTDSSGALRARYDYDPFGRQTKLSGDKEADFGYTGHYRHAPSGLLFALYRAYSPNLGRWISEDPIQFRGLTLALYPTAAGFFNALAMADGDTNPFAYVSNRTMNHVDPLGLMSQCTRDLLWCMARATGWSVLVGTAWVVVCYFTAKAGPPALICTIVGIAVVSILMWKWATKCSAEYEMCKAPKQACAPPPGPPAI
jgi:RHS repeat-associated protein